MIKSVFAATAALSLSAGAAVAGPYVNVETNAGWAAEDYTGATTDIHVGYEGALGDTASYYVQGGILLWSLSMAKMLRLSSLVRQESVLKLPRHSEYTEKSPSSLPKSMAMMNLLSVVNWVSSTPSDI